MNTAPSTAQTDRLVHVYKGTPGNHCVCDQALRLITNFPGKLSYPDGFVEDDESHVHFAFDYNRHDLIAVSSSLP